MNLRAYETAVEVYQKLKTEKLKGEIRDQVLRASLSICLNLAEGNDRSGKKDRKRFFNIALTSQREVRALIQIEDLVEYADIIDKLGAQLYLLNKKC